jgi:glycosyltransferase involved in cell wall biosynthesis
MGSAVSVIIPVFNRASLIGGAIESALEQTLPGDEVIVVDDGSTDGTPDAVRVYGDRVRMIEQSNGGAGAARNTGIAEARNPIVAFLDSDDRWLPGKLDLQRALMDHMPDVVMCFAEEAQQKADESLTHGRMVWDPNALGVPCQLQLGSETVTCHVGDAYLLFMQLGPLIQTNTVLMRRDAIPPAPFALNVKMFEEEAAFAKVARNGRLAYLDREVSVTCEHGGARLTDARTMVEAADWLTVVEAVWGQDAAFLKTHLAEYNRAFAACLIARARLYLSQGEAVRARQDFRRAGQFRWSARIASLVPPGLLGAALDLFDKLTRFIR